MSNKLRGPPGPTPTTPLRRISRGSLNALSHSASKQIAAGGTPLSFLSGAMSDLAEEVITLQGHLENLEAVHDSLGSFNENFAMYIYGLKMNAYCVEWPEAPQEDNFERAQKRLAQQAEQFAAQQHLDYAMGSANMQYGTEDVSMYTGSAGMAPGDQTYVTTDDESIYRDVALAAASNQRAVSSNTHAPAAAGRPSSLKSALKKAPQPSASSSAAKSSATSPANSSGKPPAKVQVAQRKKREAYTEEIIRTLPLEYRGNDVKQSDIAKHVCMALIASGNRGVRISDIIKMPDMTQAKINKALIALVAAKHVVKASNNGIVYSLDQARHPALP